MRLILHAGTHKTGTTSIQKALFDNRVLLREYGLIYPDGRGVYRKERLAHHGFVHGFTETSAEKSRSGCSIPRRRAGSASKTWRYYPYQRRAYLSSHCWIRRLGALRRRGLLGAEKGLFRLGSPMHLSALMSLCCSFSENVEASPDRYMPKSSARRDIGRVTPGNSWVTFVTGLSMNSRSRLSAQFFRMFARSATKRHWTRV